MSSVFIAQNSINATAPISSAFLLTSSDLVICLGSVCGCKSDFVATRTIGISGRRLLSFIIH